MADHGKRGRHGHVRFYSSCVILAFEHMHQRRIIYRTLAAIHGGELT